MKCWNSFSWLSQTSKSMQLEFLELRFFFKRPSKKKVWNYHLQSSYLKCIKWFQKKRFSLKPADKRWHVISIDKKELTKIIETLFRLFRRLPLVIEPKLADHVAFSVDPGNAFFVTLLFTLLWIVNYLHKR